MNPVITLIPRMSEKAYAVSSGGTYVFDVPMTANKEQIMAAVKRQYKVGVADVRTVITKGKPVRASRGKRSNPASAYRSNRKKAYVTLVSGESIKIFDDEGAK